MFKQGDRVKHKTKKYGEGTVMRYTALSQVDVSWDNLLCDTYESEDDLELITQTQQSSPNQKFKKGDKVIWMDGIKGVVMGYHPLGKVIVDWEDGNQTYESESDLNLDSEEEEMRREIEKLRRSIQKNQKQLGQVNIQLPYGVIVQPPSNRYNFSNPVSWDQDCEHEWKLYVGLSESFEYCLYCDTKKDEV